MKKIIGIGLLIVFLLVGCSTPVEESTPVAEEEPGVEATMEEDADAVTQASDIELTLEDLAKYNGKDGNPAFVAVDGEIYDVTDHPEWATGEHGGNLAGTDITEMLKNAPHGTAKLEDVWRVGILKESTASSEASGEETVELTLKELAAYNGEDGMPAYVAVDGKIYDVTDHPQWTTGEHGGNLAGTDISEKLKGAPHGVSKLDELTQVGQLVD